MGTWKMAVRPDGTSFQQWLPVAKGEQIPDWGPGTSHEPCPVCGARYPEVPIPRLAGQTLMEQNSDPPVRYGNITHCAVTHRRWNEERQQSLGLLPDGKLVPPRRPVRY